MIATAVAWVLLAAVSPPMAWIALGDAPDVTGPGATPGGHSGHGGIFTPTGLAVVTLMTVAMMGPLAIPGVRTVAFTSLWWRAGRAAGWFFAAFLVTWTVIAACLQTVAGMLGGVLGSPTTAAGVLVLACALAQLDPRRTDLALACDRPMRLRSRGSDANVDCARFGLRTAGRGVRLCALPMLAMLAVPVSLPVMALLTALSTADRVNEGRRRLAIGALYAILGAALFL